MDDKLKRRSIKGWEIAILLFLFISGMIVLTTFSNKQLSEMKEITYEKDINLIVETEGRPTNLMRGVKFIGDSLYFKCSAEIIKGNCADKDVEFLCELPLPYRLTKKAHSDTLRVEKGNCILYFQMIE